MLKKIIVLVLIALLLGTAGFADENKEEKPLIIVSASDFVEAMPDTAYFYMNVSVEKNTPEEAAEVGEKLRENILNVFEYNGVAKKDILVDASSAQRRYHRGAEEKHYFDYSCKVRIKDFKKISILRKDLLSQRTFEPVKDSWFSKRGLSVNTDVDYVIVDTLDGLQNAALDKAFKKALAKVRVLAKTGGLKYKIFRVIEGERSVRSLDRRAVAFEANMMMAEPMAKREAPQTIPTLQRITSQVTVEAEIL